MSENKTIALPDEFEPIITLLQKRLIIKMIEMLQQLIHIYQSLKEPNMLNKTKYYLQCFNDACNIVNKAIKQSYAEQNQLNNLLQYFAYLIYLHLLIIDSKRKCKNWIEN